MNSCCLANGGAVLADILRGAPVAGKIKETLTERTAKLREKGIVPALAILRVGERSGDLSYERGAAKCCSDVGVEVRRFILPQSCPSELLLETVTKINDDPYIHGCLVFRPLPNKEDEKAVCSMLSPSKDIDCITAESLTSVFTGAGEGFPPCTAQACIELLEHYGYDIQGKNITVIGRSLVIGKPVSMMLQSHNATVTMCHTKTRGIAEICAKAEILIAAAGKAGMVNADYTNSGQIVLDVGINVNSEGRLCGDADFDSVEKKAAAITPVPGGIGAVTSAVLVKHVVEAAEKKAKKKSL